jgi:acyl dehydratase
VNKPPLDSRPLYFEDLQTGMEFESAGRTLTETDIVNFAGLSGDYNQIHIDAEFAAATPHGGRIAHGLLVLSILSGLSTRTALMIGLSEQIVGLLNLECRWKRATKAGDTLHVRLRIDELRPTSNEKNGVVTLRRDAINQDGDIVMESEWKLLVRRAPGSAHEQ